MSNLHDYVTVLWIMGTPFVIAVTCILVLFFGIPYSGHKIERKHSEKEKD